MTTKPFRWHCLVVTGIFPPEVGGPARYVPAVATLLLERGISCSVLTLGAQSPGDPPFAFPVHYISRRFSLPRRMAVTVKKLIALAGSADVIFVHGLYLEASIAATLVRRPLVFKIVGDEVWERASRRGWTHAQLDDFQTLSGDWRIHLLRKLRRITLSLTSAVIVPSHYTAALVRCWAPNPPPIHVVPNAVETPLNPGPFALRPELGLLRNLAFVGRLIPLKRVDGVLSAIARLEGVGLIVAGDGPDREALERLAARLGIAHRVQFAGAVDQQKVAAILAQCDALVLNSTTENFPHVLLEAMAVGVPVVATKVGGIPELVEDGVSGLLVDPADEAQLARTIDRLLNDPALATRLSHGARDRARRYSWAANADAVVNVLESVRR